MVTTSSKPFNWLRVIEPETVKLQDMSATGGPEAFSWSALTQQLSQRFEIPDLSVTASSIKWETEKEIASILGKHTNMLTFNLEGLPGKAIWTMSDQDIAKLMSALLLKSPTPLDYTDKDFQAGFYRFLGIAITSTLSSLGFQGDYALSLIDSDGFPKGSGMALEIDIKLCQTTIKGHVVASEDLIKVWKERFIGSTGQMSMDPALVQDVEILVQLEVGKVTLPRSQLKSIHIGDFIILDSCTVLPGEDKGRVMLTVRGSPIFRGMLKENRIKILEYPLYHKVETPMDQDKNLEFDATVEDDDVTSEATEQVGEAPSMAERAKDIPVTISVEVGRLHMKLEKLMQLQPGQLLELEVNPEEGVNLVINGQCMGKGELLRLGEVLGVRVLELG